MREALSSFKLIAGAFALAAVVALPKSAQAASFSAAIDPTQSYLSLVGGIAVNYPGPGPGLPANAQVAGSLFDYWGGTLNGNISGSTVTFSGGSTITAASNPNGPFKPTNFGTNSLVDNYGTWSTGLVSGIGSLSITGAYRGLVLDIPLGTATDGLAPSGMNLKFTAGALEFGYNIPALGGFGGGVSPMNTTGANTTAALFSITTDGLGNQWLTLPVAFQTTGGSGRVENWTGQIVAQIALKIGRAPL